MSFVVPEVIAMCLGLREGVAQAPAAVAELPCEAQPAAAVLSLQAVPVLREISESDLRLILPCTRRTGRGLCGVGDSDGVLSGSFLLLLSAFDSN